ncbi:MAG: ATP-binding cassette domain-containing protein [Verrucomicrobiaceae bacterium]|nr:ATP-binding cassette domain-containing protein [Verrucomicrobiaceae bacterium]
MSKGESIIAVSGLIYRYPNSPFELSLSDFKVKRGERVALTGPSGCGKTTLLRLITGLLAAESGEICLGGRTVGELDEAEKRSLRITRVGAIPQELDLLDYLSVEENMLLPYFINNALALTQSVRKECERLADALGLANKSSRFPHQLSQGERQRVAIARALITQPEILIADEPTGNLDGVTARQVLDLVGELIRARETTFLMVTHDLTLLDFFDRRFDLGKEVASS